MDDVLMLDQEPNPEYDLDEEQRPRLSRVSHSLTLWRVIINSESLLSACAGMRLLFPRSETWHNGKRLMHISAVALPCKTPIQLLKANLLIYPLGRGTKKRESQSVSDFKVTSFFWETSFWQDD